LGDYPDDLWVCLFWLTSAGDRDEVFNNGPYVVDDATLAWSLSFLPSPHRLSRTVLWMRLPNLPTVCWNAPTLELIISAAGRFVKMDESISLMTKGRYARVVVDVDSSRPLVPGADVVLEGIDAPVFWQCFEYEHIHLFYPRYGCIGHRSIDYESPPPSPTNNLSSSQPIGLHLRIEM